VCDALNCDVDECEFSGVCHCGCGDATKVSEYTHAARGYKRGFPMKYLTGHHLRDPRHPHAQRNKGELHASWTGGRYVHHGYRYVNVGREHPMAGSTGYVPEHRLVVAAAIGRPLRDYEQVHHINGDKLDNRLENLQLVIAQHGNGLAYECAECGSRNVSPALLLDSEQLRVA
jgi:hypothetical protein